MEVFCEKTRYRVMAKIYPTDEPIHPSTPAAREDYTTYYERRHEWDTAWRDRARDLSARLNLGIGCRITTEYADGINLKKNRTAIVIQNSTLLTDYKRVMRVVEAFKAEGFDTQIIEIYERRTRREV